MAIFGTIAAVILSVLFMMLLGPYGIIVLLSLIFGMVLSTHMRTKEIQNDLQRIKEKLGIEDPNDFNMSNEEIEQELEKEMETDELREINQQIEKELEEYADSADKDTKKK
jgi:hypothetical protein